MLRQGAHGRDEQAVLVSVECVCIPRVVVSAVRYAGAERRYDRADLL